MDARDVIRRYLLEHAVAAGVTAIEEERPLQDQGVLDSFGLVELVEFLEREFHLQVADDEIDAREFATLQSICNFVRRKQAAPAGGGAA
jgi:acyl carrier protein